MAESEASSAPITNFAQFEAAGGKYNAPAAPAAEKNDAGETTPPSEAQAGSAAEAETADTQSVQTEKAGAAAEAAKKPPQRTGKPSLSDEHARLLREVTELRRERRELQQPPTTRPPAPEAGTAAASTAAEDKPPVRPKLSTFPGTLDEYEAEVEKYDELNRKYLEQQYVRKQAAEQAQAAQQRIVTTYGEKLADHLQQHPDYDAEIAATPMSTLMVDIVLHEGPGLGQMLIDDKTESRRIESLPRDVQIFEMGKLAARLNGNGSAAVSDDELTDTTPAPVKIPQKVGGGSGTTKALNRPDHGAKSFAEFEAITKRLAKKRS
jgi:hypothetical protein